MDQMLLDKMEKTREAVEHSREEIAKFVESQGTHLLETKEELVKLVEEFVEDGQQKMHHFVEEGQQKMHELVEEGQQKMHELVEEGQQKMHELEQLWREMDWTYALPLILVGAAAWSVLMRKYSGNEYIASTIHAIIVVILAFANLIIGLDETYLFILMTGYFISDLFHYCLSAKYFVYIFHHVITVFAVYYMVSATSFSVRMFASKAALVEISTPFLNQYRMTNKQIYAVLFGISFFLVRIVWLGVISTEGLYLATEPIESITISLFGLLNIYWFGLIIKGAVFPEASSVTATANNKNNLNHHPHVENEKKQN